MGVHAVRSVRTSATLIACWRLRKAMKFRFVLAEYLVIEHLNRAILMRNTLKDN